MLYIKIKAEQTKKDIYIWWLFIIWIGLFSCLHGEGDDLKFDRLSQRDGLSNNVVTSILQDSKGFMWFGTQEGLNRYDGYEFKVFTHQPGDSGSLSDNSVAALWEDGHGVLWVGTDSGLNAYDPQTERFTRYRNDPNDSNTISSDDIMAICQDRQGELWIGTKYNGQSGVEYDVCLCTLCRQ
jgi:ligand-binding sensor domain-containing protein